MFVVLRSCLAVRYYLDTEGFKLRPYQFWLDVQHHHHTLRNILEHRCQTNEEHQAHGFYLGPSRTLWNVDIKDLGEMVGLESLFRGCQASFVRSREQVHIQLGRILLRCWLGKARMIRWNNCCSRWWWVCGWGRGCKGSARILIFKDITSDWTYSIDTWPLVESP